jgi:hypothetical protein
LAKYYNAYLEKMTSITEKLTNTISSLVSRLTSGNGPGSGGGPGGGGGGLNNSFTHMNLDDSMLGLGTGTASRMSNSNVTGGAGMPNF